jgi:hypothetical protein
VRPTFILKRDQGFCAKKLDQHERIENLSVSLSHQSDELREEKIIEKKALK